MSWRDKLREISDRIFGNREPPDVPVSKTAIETPSLPEERKQVAVALSSVPQIVALNLGIDFGTSFTKVCYRDAGTDESGIVAIGKGLKEALLPSVVLVGSDGFLSLDDRPRQPNSVAVTYLKMRLAGTPIADDSSESPHAQLSDIATIKVLASWFLASVIARSQKWISVNEVSRLKNRTPVWSANVGVPVAYCDSPALATFEEVLGVAWVWTKDMNIPPTLGAALQEYEAAKARLEHEVADIHAIPEIAAAVQSFVTSREAVPGIYVYFDIGGGTLDGVAFNYVNYSGERRINFYSGKVESLGISAIGAALNRGRQVDVDVGLLEALLKKCRKDVCAKYERRIRRLVGYIVMTAKRKDGRDWQVDAIQSAYYERRFIGQLSPDRMKPLIVFVGGGGSMSKWYCSTIRSTYFRFAQSRAGVPPYRLLKVQRPKDLTLKNGDDFTRFAISYGLSIPFGEGPDFHLPSHFPEPEKPTPTRWTPPGIISYEDSKDVYD